MQLMNCNERCSVLGVCPYAAQVRERAETEQQMPGLTFKVRVEPPRCVRAERTRLSRERKKSDSRTSRGKACINKTASQKHIDEV